MTQTLYICRGLPASGKSTFAQHLVDKSYGQIVRIERDMLRDQLYNNRFYTRPVSWTHMTDEDFSFYMSARENTITQVQYSMVAAAFISNKSVVVSDTNLPAKVVKSWIAVAEKNNVSYEIINFDEVSVDECIKRDAARDNSVGEEVIRKMANRFLVKGKIPEVKLTESKNWIVESYSNPEDLPAAIIVDIDGTLAKMQDRSPYEWSRVGEDSPVKPVINAVSVEYQAGAKIIVMSGRDGSCRDTTMSWLTGNLRTVSDFELFMRAEGDTRKDDLVKYELFNENIRDKYHVKYVLDDRDQVVKMWRSLGLACFQVAEGNF